MELRAANAALQVKVDSLEQKEQQPALTINEPPGLMALQQQQPALTINEPPGLMALQQQQPALTINEPPGLMALQQVISSVSCQCQSLGHGTLSSCSVMVLHACQHIFTGTLPVVFGNDKHAFKSRRQ